MLKVLFSAQDDRWAEYQGPLSAAFEAADLPVDLSRDLAPDTVDYIVFAPNGPVTDFRPYTRCKAVMSLWAGVETVVDNATLTQPLVRMVDDGLTAGMVEWVSGHVLRHHLGIDTHIHGQDGVWRVDSYAPLARDRRVTILGLGALGQACATALVTLGFDVTGWSRSAKDTAGLRCFHGDDGLMGALEGAEIVVLLLPDTPQTANTLNAQTLAKMARGGVVINPGRGPLIDDDALIAALDSGQLSHATLDVFRQEPLPPQHPFWAHPQVTVTPHIASTTRPDTAANVIARTIQRSEAGQPLIYTVDRRAGY